MNRIFNLTRFLVFIPIIGLVLAVHFMSNLFIGSETLLDQGLGIGHRQNREAEAIVFDHDPLTLSESLQLRDDHV